MDTFLLTFSFAFVLVVVPLIGYVLFKLKKFPLKPYNKTTDFSKEIDKLLEKEKEKDIIHESRVNKLTTEITDLKESQAELLLTNKNWEKSYNKLNAELLSQVSSLEKQIAEVSEQKKKVTSQKKSSEVRLGNIAETLAPFLDQFNFDPENCVFLGRPIDYISFGDDEITFIEVKSGKSQLNSRQRQIRDLVKSKYVAWKEVRIK